MRGVPSAGERFAAGPKEAPAPEPDQTSNLWPVQVAVVLMSANGISGRVDQRLSAGS